MKLFVKDTHRHALAMSVGVLMVHQDLFSFYYVHHV